MKKDEMTTDGLVRMLQAMKDQVQDDMVKALVTGDKSDLTERTEELIEESEYLSKLMRQVGDEE